MAEIDHDIDNVRIFIRFLAVGTVLKVAMGYLNGGVFSVISEEIKVLEFFCLLCFFFSFSVVVLHV